MKNLANEIFVRTKQPDDTRRRNYVIDYAIKIPQSFEVKIDNRTGDINVESINDSITANLVTGQTTLNSINASTVAKVTTGNIISKQALPENGTINMTVTTGNIELNIPADISGKFSARVTTGNVRMDSTLTLESAIETANTLTGTLEGGAGQVTLAVTTGDIRINRL